MELQRHHYQTSMPERISKITDLIRFLLHNSGLIYHLISTIGGFMEYAYRRM
jgi:hypothetical protein